MIFFKTKFPGALIIEPEKIKDERGFFARIWCSREIESEGMNPHIVQCNISFNHKRGTIRGLHYQKYPHAEAKIARCTMGAIYDVIIDLRPESPTYLQWQAEELTCENRRMMFIPEGFAHGFQTLVDNTEVFYQMSEYYFANSASGIRWNDPAINIYWPLPVSIISEKDNTYPLLKEKP